jgi:hypothetical protein
MKWVLFLIVWLPEGHDYYHSLQLPGFTSERDCHAAGFVGRASRGGIPQEVWRKHHDIEICLPESAFYPNAPF